MGRRADLWPYPQDPEYYNIMCRYNYQQHHFDQNEYESMTYYASLPHSSYNDYILDGRGTTAQLGYGSYDDQQYSPYSSYDDHHQQQQPPFSTMYNRENHWQATAIFNDENPHACSIM